MAGETGSARQEAERLVATVLAMAGRPGDDSLAGAGARLVEGLGTLGDTVAGVVGRLTAPPDEPRTPAAAARPAEGPVSSSRDTDAGVGTPGQASPAGGTTGPHDDEHAGPAVDPPLRSLGEDLRNAWAAATKGGGIHGEVTRDRATQGWAIGSPECCVCPVCRTIASMRNPTPEAAERLATGAGDLATGVASLMRAVSAMSGSRPRPARPTRPAPPPPPNPDTAWSAATRTGDPPDAPADAEDESPWAAATHAAAREQRAEALARAEAVARERAEAARARAEAARRRVEEARAAAEAARQARAAETAAAGEGAAGDGAAGEGAAGEGGRPGTPAWTAGPRRGQDVWAAATADPGDVGVTRAPGVDHDVAGDEA